MAAHRKSDPRRDDLCVGGLRKRIVLVIEPRWLELLSWTQWTPQSLWSRQMPLLVSRLAAAMEDELRDLIAAVRA